MVTIKKEDLACKCGCAPSWAKDELIDLINALIIKTGISVARVEDIISSGCRCSERNMIVRGSPNSAHLTGEAVDLRTGDSRTRYLMLNAINDLGIKRIGIDDGFIHIDISRTLPQRVTWMY